MEQLAKVEPSEHFESHSTPRPLVFLDTTVIIGYLRGDKAAVELFSEEAAGRVRLAVNAIVFQELLLAADAAARPEFQEIRDRLSVLPMDLVKAEALLPRVRAIRNRLAHPNDILILSSADECDFLVTTDSDFKNFAADKPKVVTPEELIEHLRSP